MPIPKIFISYAHEDITFQEELVKRLKPLKRKREIVLWHDGVIMPGEEWDTSIKKHLEAANIIIVLLSADFVASDYIYEQELPRIIERRQKGEIQLVPIVARGVTLDGTNIEMYQCLPQDGHRRLKPIVEWAEREIDKVWVQIDNKIRGVINLFSQLAEGESKPNEVTFSPKVQSTPQPIIQYSRLQDVKAKIQSSITEDLEEAFKLVDTTVAEVSSIRRPYIQLLARYNRNKKKEMLGTVSQDHIDREYFKITDALLYLINQLKEKDLVT